MNRVDVTPTKKTVLYADFRIQSRSKRGVTKRGVRVLGSAQVIF